MHAALRLCQHVTCRTSPRVLLQVRSCARMQPSVLSVNEASTTRWLRLNTIKYTDEKGTERLWDACERTTRKADASADGAEVRTGTANSAPLTAPSAAVVILAVLRRQGAEPHTLLVKQFRPPMGAHTVELPAGLIDPGESAQLAALRELKEETGYTATARAVQCKEGVSFASSLTLFPSL